MKFFFDSSNSNEAIAAKEKFIKEYRQHSAENADVIVPIGGDGFLLKSLHDFKQFKKPFYGINYGSIGFLMNTESDEKLDKIISSAQQIELKPLKMKAKNNKEETFESIAFNEVSIMRQTHQASKISIKINDIERMSEKELSQLSKDLDRLLGTPTPQDSQLEKQKLIEEITNSHK